jgi:hypothetical protein
MKSWRFLLAFLGLTGLLVAARPLCGLSWFSRGNIVIPFRTIHGKIVAAMSLNGKPRKNFVIDTGAFSTMFNASAVSADGLRTISVHGTVHCFGGDVPVTRAVQRATIFGYGLQITGIGAVFDLSSLQHSLGIPLTGIIGSDTIASQPILVDYQAGKITMFLKKRIPHLRKSAERISLVSPPPGAEKFGGPVIPAQLELPNGRIVKLNLEIDTGSQNALTLYKPFAVKYGLLASNPKGTVTNAGCGGKFGLAPAALPAVFIGNQKIPNPKTLSAEKAVGAAASTDVDGEIGYKILSRFRIFIDRPQHFVVFEPASQN